MAAQLKAGDWVQFRTIVGTFRARVGPDNTLYSVAVVSLSKRASAARDSFLKDGVFESQKMADVRIVPEHAQ